TRLYCWLLESWNTKVTEARSQVNSNKTKGTEYMKNAILIVLGLAVGTAAALAQTGNGAPSGGHYNLNILGKTDCTPADLTGSDRHTIQVLRLAQLRFYPPE